MIYFMGTSFAAKHLKEAAIKRGNEVTEDITEASLIFVSEDTPTNKDGTRRLGKIRDMVLSCPDVSIVLTSQVPVGFTRSFNIPYIYHQAETLRIKDAEDRAFNPEQIIVGIGQYDLYLPVEYEKYLLSFNCPVHYMQWEEAEFSKIAINLTLISQVKNTNELYQYADKRGIRWGVIKEVLQHDKRIGKHSYLEPGRWQDSPHLLRDYVTFNEG